MDGQDGKYEEQICRNCKFGHWSDWMEFPGRAEFRRHIPDFSKPIESPRMEAFYHDGQATIVTHRFDTEVFISNEDINWEGGATQTSDVAVVSVGTETPQRRSIMRRIARFVCLLAGLALNAGILLLLVCLIGWHETKNWCESRDHA